MISKSDLTHILLNQSENIKKERAVPRQLKAHIKKQSELVSIVTGIRRSGKSTLLKELMKDYRKFRYVNFEDFRLAGFEQNDFQNLELAFADMAPDCSNYFFDEIQNVSGWENYIRTLNDSKKTIFITGSNASLLSKELGTKLTGRHVNYELYPMDFFEFCAMKKRTASKDALGDYLAEGGFPQYLKTGISDYLQQILIDILFRDIVKRHSIRNIAVLEDLTQYLISHVAKEYSLRNIAKFLKTDSIHTLSEYVAYLEDAYLFFTIPIFSRSLKKQAVNPRKIYCIDNALTAANSKSFSGDKGRLLENMVFLQLRRNFKDIFYYKNRGECDFIVKQQNAVHSIIQVCFELAHENIERELRGLEEAMRETRCSNAVLVTMNENGSYETQAGPVKSICAFDWIKSFHN